MFRRKSAPEPTPAPLTVRPQFSYGRVIRLHALDGLITLGSYDPHQGTWEVTHPADLPRVQAAINQHLADHTAVDTAAPVQSDGPADLAHLQASAAAQQAVADVLTRLPAPWLAVHDLPTTPATHHVAIGPGGVYALTSHPGKGKYTIKGTSGDLAAELQTAQDAADRVTAAFLRTLRLDVPVAPLLVLAGARKVVTVTPHPRVHALTDRDLLAYLLDRTSGLSAWELDTFRAAARNTATWTG